MQAEGPPSAVLGKLKQAIKQRGALGCDVAFYFVHWVTDLAGWAALRAKHLGLRHPHPKDPSVLKIIRRSNPYYFATAIVFQYPYTVFLRLFASGPSGPKPPVGGWMSQT